MNFQTICQFSEDIGQYSPAGKRTAKPITSSSNEVPDTMHVNEERLKPKCVKLRYMLCPHTHTHACTHTHTHMQADQTEPINNTRTSRCLETHRYIYIYIYIYIYTHTYIHTHITISFHSPISRFTMTQPTGVINISNVENYANTLPPCGGARYSVHLTHSSSHSDGTVFSSVSVPRLYENKHLVNIVHSHIYINTHPDMRGGRDRQENSTAERS